MGVDGGDHLKKTRDHVVAVTSRKVPPSTGRINGKGYGFRVRWKEILDGKRTDPAYTNAVKLSLAYAVGNPGTLRTRPRSATA